MARTALTIAWPTRQARAAGRATRLAALAMALQAGAPVRAAADSDDPAQPLSTAELAIVDQRLTPVVPAGTRTLELAPGGAVLSTAELEIPGARLRGGEGDYEAMVYRPVTAGGIALPRRADSFRISRAGSTAKIVFTYLVYLEAGAQAGGETTFSLALIERQGVANELGSVPMKHRVTLAPLRISGTDLAADFRGYRHYKQRAEAGLIDLTRAGLRGLTVKESVSLPPLDRVSAAVALRAMEFDRARRRMAIARRHLEAAQASADRATSAQARAYLALVDADASQLAQLPKVPLVSDATAGRAKVEDVDTRPKRVETSKAEAGGVLVPLDSAPRAEPRAEEPRPREEPKPVVQPTPTPEAGTSGERIAEREDLTFERERREEIVPSMPRGLTLDDPNIGFGASVRFAYSRVNDRRQAEVPTWFFGAQASITRDLGLELTIPTALLSLDLERAQTVFTMGNPLIAAKYRFQLPRVGDRRPVLTLRGRWAIPIVARNSIPPTEFRVDRFSQPPTFADTYAFFLEKNDVSFGVSAAWEASIVHIAAQLYGDYFFPVSGSGERSQFFALGYGLSVGVRPFGKWVAAYAEARGVRMFLGPNRSELYTYLGLASQLFDHWEPAVFIGIPVGSISAVTGVQLGVELRFMYDVESVIDRGRRPSRTLDLD